MQQEGIILRTYQSGEADLILRVVTPERGRISIMARNARRSKKRFGNPPDIFDCGMFDLHRARGPLPSLNSFRSMATFAALRADLDKMATASLLCEALEALTIDEHIEESKQLFQTLKQGLSTIDSCTGCKECYRALYESLASVLEICGYLDRSLLPPASAKNLIRLVESAEEHSEKKLQSKTTLLSMIQLMTSTP